MTDTTETHSTAAEVSDSKANVTITETIPSDTDSNQEVSITHEDLELGEANLTKNPADISKGSSSPSSNSLIGRMMQCANDYDFLIGLMVSILLAKAYPPLGTDYLKPQYTATWIAVIYIFRTYYEFQFCFRVTVLNFILTAHIFYHGDSFVRFISTCDK